MGSVAAQIFGGVLILLMSTGLTGSAFRLNPDANLVWLAASTKVDQLVACIAQSPQQFFLKLKSAVIGGNSYAHSLSFVIRLFRTQRGRPARRLVPGGRGLLG